jgi:2-oxoisovalerate dehydrogenase E1 component beta subunit
VSHEACRTSGFGAEIASEIQEQCFLYLESPISRVTGIDTPYPLALEKEYMADHFKIYEAIKSSVKF